MKKFKVTFIALLLSVLWLMSVGRASAQAEHLKLEQEIAQAKFEINLCLARIERAERGYVLVDSIMGGPPSLVDPEDSYPPEERIKRARACIEQAEKRLKELREKLAKLPPLPSSRKPDPPKPPEDPKRKELLDALEEVQRLSAEYGKRLVVVEKRAKRLQPKPGYDVNGESAGGVLIGTFTTPYGKVQVFLPDDLRAGDTTTTTIKLEPSGKTEAERSPNLSKLAKMSIEYRPQFYFRTTDGTGEAKLPEGAEMVMPGDNVAMEVELITPIAMEKGVRFAIPEGGRTESVDIILKGEDGEEKIGVGIPVGPKEDKPTSQREHSPGDTFPKIVQDGGHVEIRYPSNNARTVEVLIGGKPAQVVAESPRKLIVKCPENITGPVEIVVKEGNSETKGTTRVVGVRLSAPKTNLMRGEKTTVTVEVSGLEGIKKDVPLQLDTKGVVQMEGGNVQYLRIRPQDVKDGRFTTTRAITGQQTGGFVVTATVVHRLLIWLQENARKNGYRVRRDGGGFVVDIENVDDPLTGDPLDGEYVLEYRCTPFGTTSLIPVLVKKGRTKVNPNLFDKAGFCPPTPPSQPNMTPGEKFQQFSPRVTQMAIRFDW